MECNTPYATVSTCESINRTPLCGIRVHLTQTRFVRVWTHRGIASCLTVIEIVFALQEVTNIFTGSCQICDDPWEGKSKFLFLLPFLS